MNHEIIARYVGQPARLPSELRAHVERSWGGQPVQLYALADLDHTLRLAERWLLLGPAHVAVATPNGEPGGWEVRSVERAHVRAVRDAPGLSANTLLLLGADGEPPLLA